jgi:hypothetical protein
MIKPPKLEDYSVSKISGGPPDEVQRVAAAEGLEAAPSAPRFVITLRGENFVQRALMLNIRIGDVHVNEYSISDDQKTIVCYLDELPADGSVIRVGYGPDEMVELPERFSHAKLESGELEV